MRVHRLALLASLLAVTATGALAQDAETVSEWGPLTLLGEDVQPGERRRLRLTTGESFAGVSVSTPVIVARGREEGPTLCLTAGIHGDELIGVEVVRHIMETAAFESLRGTLVGIPIVNPQGFRRSSRYLPDRRDLNRHFPGRERGSAASRIAHAVFQGVIRHCDSLVDFHTGSFHRTNLPQLRSDLRSPSTRELAQRFGAEIVIHGVGRLGTLRRAAVDAGIPAITYEAGEPMRFQADQIQSGVEGTRRLMYALGMTWSRAPRLVPQQLYYRTYWIRVDDGGILLTAVRLGDAVAAGDVLGTVTDPISNERTIVRAPASGRLIGMALNQVVIPGFAAYHMAVANAALTDGSDELDDDLADDAIELERDLRPEE